MTYLTRSLLGWEAADPRRRQEHRRVELALLLAQTAWGEAVIQPALVKLKHMLPGAAAQRMIDSQLFDEERHEKAYRQATAALDASCLDRMPSHYEAMQRLFAETDEPFTLMIGMHVCLESFALGAFAYRAAYCQSPAIQRLDVEAQQDEERHVAFGPILAKLLRRQGASCQSSMLREQVRKMHAIYLHDDLVGTLQMRIAMLPSPQPSLEENAAMDEYRRLCDRFWLANYKDFMAVAVKAAPGEVRA